MWEAIELRANRGTEHCTCTANSGNATLFMIEASQDMIFSRFSSLSLSFWSSPFLTGRPITGIAQKFLSQLEQFLKTSISLKKKRRRKQKKLQGYCWRGKREGVSPPLPKQLWIWIAWKALISRESDRSIRGEFIYFYNSSYLNNSRSI